MYNAYIELSNKGRNLKEKNFVSKLNNKIKSNKEYLYPEEILQVLIYNKINLKKKKNFFFFVQK